MNTAHAALVQPEMSCRLNTSPRMPITIQIQITHEKKMIIVQKTSRNG